jgi:chemotaxis protein methyltransferase CheR
LERAGKKLKAFHAEEMTDADFGKISRLVYEVCGINLTDGKKELLKARLRRVIGKGSFLPSGPIMSTSGRIPRGGAGPSAGCGPTHFTGFREPQHFDYLRAGSFPRWPPERRPRKAPLLGAGVLRGRTYFGDGLDGGLDHPETWDLRIVATDLSAKC